MTAPGSLPYGKGVTGADTPGISDDEIVLGFPTLDAEAFNAAAKSVGLSVVFADLDRMRRVVVDYINKRGGIAGRQIREVVHEIAAANAVTADGRARDAQAACATYTEDNAVFAFADIGAWTEDNITECAAAHNTLLMQVSQAGALVSYRRYDDIAPYYLSPDRFIVEERDRAYVDGLVAARILPPDAKVGLLIDDVPAAHEGVEGVLKPLLARHGVDLVAEAAYPDIIESPWETYVLQFRQAGVTHVLFSSTSYGFWPLQNFARAAESQRYEPWYGLSSEQAASIQATQAPPGQLERMAGVGWFPAFDVGPDKVETPGMRRCADALAEAGMPESDVRSAAPFCEYVFLLHDAFAAAPELSAGGLMRGLEAVSATYGSPLLERIRFRPGRPDGPAMLRPFAWNSDCSCFNYTAAGRPLN